MNNLVLLSKKHIFIVICNPLFYNAKSNIQKRKSSDFYDTQHIITKTMFATKRDRLDFHYPLGFYENLFKRFNLKIENLFQSGDTSTSPYRIYNSDFMFFSLIKE